MKQVNPLTSSFTSFTSSKSKSRWRQALVASAVTLTALAASAAGPTASVPGQSRIWLVGGGPDPQRSQGQIELNVLWVADILRTLTPQAQLRIFFADPSPEIRDVKVWSRPADNVTSLQPLARVFGQQEHNGNEYHRHRITGTFAGTRADMLQEALGKDFSAMQAQDRGLLVFNGHGLRDLKDRSGNTLRLWDDTTMSVRELEALSGKAPATAPMRFVFTQCYSGGFMRLIRPGARDVRELTAYNRCGFASESADRISEGCSASIEVGDYRDYTTYFFAALSGKTRTGQPLKRSPDFDGDGTVTLHEAHLYAVLEGDNADLPRSTSEVYLERWQPGWLRYLDTRSEPDNEYGRLAQALAQRLKLPTHGSALVQALQTRHQELDKRLKQLKKETEQLEMDIAQLQTTLAQGVKIRWPEAAHPYTAGYSHFLNNDLNAAQNYIIHSPAYMPLATKQDRLAKVELEKVDLDRTVTQLDKVLRLRHLARLRQQFERFATPQARQDYARLSQCERTPL